MSTALEAASLIMIPTSYSDGLLASVKPNDGAGDFTFTRGSNISATRVNADGNIEKGYENFLLRSNTFSDAVWTKFQSSITGGQEGYDGTNDAWILEKTAASGRLIQYNVSASGVVALSIYAKAGTLNWMRLLDPTTNQGSAYFNLSNGEVYKDFGIDAKIESAGNGWYRCSVVGSLSSGQFWLLPADGDGDTSGTSGNILIQDAMVNQGLAAYPYVETTTAPVAGGILEDMPRIDFSGGNQSLLLEPSRINSITSSEYFQSGWSNLGSRVSFEDNTADTLSPEGKYNATKLIKNSSGNPTLRAFATTPGNAYVFTCWAKAGTSNILELDISDATPTNFTLTNEWQRFEVKTTSSANNFVDISLRTVANVGDYIYVWGAQVEEGSYPTSYIPTYGTSQTRLAEDLELPTLSSVFDSTGSFTLFFEIERLSSSVQQQILYIRGQGYFRLDATADNRLKFVIYGGGASVTEANSDINTFVAGTSSKIIYKQNGTIGQCFINGQEISSGTPTILTGFFTFYQRNENHIKHKEVYFPTALSDDECIELTTI